MAKVFVAQWDGGFCPACSSEEDGVYYDIKKGEEVSYLPSGELLHAECNEMSDFDGWFNEVFDDED